jgi:hypothetical protein
MSVDEAERLYSEVFHTLLQSHADVQTFRQVAELGKPAAEASLGMANYSFALSIQSDPAYDAYFKDRKRAVEYLGGPEVMGSKTTKIQLQRFAQAIDAASLIFVHSAVDAAVSDLCRVSLLLAPLQWEKFVADKKATLHEVRTQGVEEVFRGKLEAHMEALQKESLPKRADRLFAVCKPARDFDPIRGYVYDRDELVSVDDTRHLVVHGSGVAQPIVDCEKKLEFLVKTGLFFTGMVNASLGVKINPLYALGLQIPVAAPA